MPIYLRQSTSSQEIPLGYFLDSTDGDTAKTGLTIANTDIVIWKTGATTLASKNSGGGTHISSGVYYAVLDATDTDTIGPLVIFCHVSGALAVRVECCVLDEAVYDSIFGTTALSTLTAAGIRSAVGMASANMDTQLSTIAGYVDTEVGAIKAKTDNLPSDPADASDIAASFATVNSTLATIAGYVDTEIAAIKAQTDKIPSSPAAAADIPTAAQVADKILGRNLAGGSDGGRMVKDALRVMRNRMEITPVDGTSGTVTIYAENDTTIAWTGTVSFSPTAKPVTGVDPA